MTRAHAFVPMPSAGRDREQHIYCPRCGTTRWVRANGGPADPCPSPATDSGLRERVEAILDAHSECDRNREAIGGGVSDPCTFRFAELRTVLVDCPEARE